MEIDARSLLLQKLLKCDIVGLGRMRTTGIACGVSWAPSTVENGSVVSKSRPMIRSRIVDGM